MLKFCVDTTCTPHLQKLTPELFDFAPLEPWKTWIDFVCGQAVRVKNVKSEIRHRPTPTNRQVCDISFDGRWTRDYVDVLEY